MIEKYSGNWDDLAGVRNDFAVSDDRENFPTDEEMIAAIYNYEDYSGYAFVLYKKDGKFYEVNSSHCSCNG